MAKQLSKHDEDLLRKIREIDDEWGWVQWPEISHLADQLEDEDVKKRWNRICISYNHYEEASIGEL